MKQKTLPTISIVTPSYNQAQFITETIESVLVQKYTNLEYVVMDGGSTDETKNLLFQYGKRLSFESKKDNGQTDAINKGLSATSGEIFAYLNSDDYYLPNTLKTVARIFTNDAEITWVVGDAVIVDINGKEIQGFVRAYKRFFRKIYSALVLKTLNPLPQPSIFIRRSCLEEVGYFDEKLRYTMDYDMWLKLQARFGNPFIIDQPLSAFRIHGSSKGGSQYHKQFAEELQVVAKYTKNPILLWLHWLHNQCILAAYSYLK